MRVLFMGTPEFAAISLKKIIAEHEVIGVFTQPDKVNQRGNKIKYSSVKQLAIENKIEVFQPVSVRKEEVILKIKELKPDIIVVVAYGKILPNNLIEIPKYGTINVHASLLPKYRGAAPIHASIINGESETGVTIMDIAEELDAGDMILKKSTPILEEDNLETVHDRLADIGAEALSEALQLIANGKVEKTPQNHSEATFVKPIRKEECKIDWSMSNKEIFDKVRGMNPFPTAFTTLNDKILKIYEVEKSDNNYNCEIGEVAEIFKDKGVAIKTGKGSVILKKVKPENKSLISGKDLINGNYIKAGDRLK